MRIYLTHFYSHGMHPVTPAPECVSASHASVRVVAVIWFRRVFGREPDSSWGWKGHMAGAKDRHGNEILVDQINHDQRPGFDVKTGRFPLALHRPRTLNLKP